MYQEIRAELGHLTSWGQLEMKSSVEVFHGHYFGAERREAAHRVTGFEYLSESLSPFKPLIHLIFMLLLFPDKFLRSL